MLLTLAPSWRHGVHVGASRLSHDEHRSCWSALVGSTSPILHPLARHIEIESDVVTDLHKLDSPLGDHPPHVPFTDTEEIRDGLDVKQFWKLQLLHDPPLLGERRWPSRYAATRTSDCAKGPHGSELKAGRIGGPPGAIESAERS
jgi:hypothetical protein